MKQLFFFIALLFLFISPSCSSREIFIDGDRTYFVGYGTADSRHLNHDVWLESGRKSSSINAAYRISEAIYGKYFDFSKGVSETSGVLPSKGKVSYKETRPGLFRCTVAVKNKHINFSSWKKTHRISGEFVFPGDFNSVTVSEYSNFLEDVEKKNMKLIEDDARMNNLVHDDKLKLAHLYILNDMQDNGTMKILIIYTDQQ